jgi:hypothetical protein
MKPERIGRRRPVQKAKGIRCSAGFPETPCRLSRDPLPITAESSTEIGTRRLAPQPALCRTRRDGARFDPAGFVFFLPSRRQIRVQTSPACGNLPLFPFYNSPAAESKPAQKPQTPEAGGYATLLNFALVVL